MSTFTNAMFESIKGALTKNNTESSANNKFKDILRTEAGNTFTVRLLPNVKNPGKTFFHSYSYAWNSFSTGQLVTVASPTTWNLRDPIAEYRYKTLKTGTEKEKEKVLALKRRENWMVNVYVINDPVNSENNGKVKILRFGRQLHKIIMDAIEGEDSAELGARIFDLSPKGCSFKIKVEKQGDFPTYVSSKFVLPKEIENLNESEYKAIYDGTFDLEKYVTAKSYDEIQDMLAKHYHCSEDVEEDDGATEPAVKEAVTVVVKAPAAAAKPIVSKVDADADADATLSELLKDL